MKFVGERRVLAAVVFIFYALIYSLGAWWMAGPVSPAFYALGFVYGLAFFSLVAGYFWARWYCVGVGLYGVISAVVSLIQIMRMPPDQLPPEAREMMINIMTFVGITHFVAVVLLWGAAMAAKYDGQTGWREKLHMDDSAVQRLGRAVIRAGVSLPLVLMYAFAPKQPASMVLGIGVLAAVAFGMRALVKARAVGVLALAAAGTTLLSMAFVDAFANHDALALRSGLAGALLLAAAAPFARSMVRFVRGV